MHAETTFTEHPDEANPTRLGKGTADADVAGVILTIPGLPTIEAEVLTSSASATCADASGPPALSSTSEVVKVTIGTTVIQVPSGGGPQTISLAPLGDLHLNHTSGGVNTVTQRALFLDTSLVDVVVAESTAGYTGNPCTAPIVVPECRDGVDNDGDTKIDFPDDPGCSDPDDDDETSECDDGIDNADPEDTLIDENDPGCHNDGDPTNPASYEPWDNNETDGGGGGECDDGIDNDDDGDIDFPEDDDCDSPDDPSEDDDPECSDGEDNDDAEDAESDEADPDCHDDFDPDDGDDSFDPDGSESCDEVPSDTPGDEPDGDDPDDDLGQPDDEDCSGAERGQ